MDYVVEGAMIGGFALVAAPADYAVTGVKTFMVGNDGVVYEKDYSDRTLDEFKKMERFNPDGTWTPVKQEVRAGAPPTTSASRSWAGSYLPVWPLRDASRGVDASSSAPLREIADEVNGLVTDPICHRAIHRQRG